MVFVEEWGYRVGVLGLGCSLGKHLPSSEGGSLGKHLPSSEEATHNAPGHAHYAATLVPRYHSIALLLVLPRHHTIALLLALLTCAPRHSAECSLELRCKAAALAIQAARSIDNGDVRNGS